MDVYDSKGRIILCWYSEKDFNLTLDFENISCKELEEIVIILRNSSSYCHEDILNIARIIIDELDFINYDIIKAEYKEFVSLVHTLFRTLNIIKNKTELIIIYNNFNKYIKGKQDNSNPTSPVSPPPVKN
jgi:hypothetical protein